jgi:hypothetical protein
MSLTNELGADSGSHRSAATFPRVSEAREERLAKNEATFRVLNENILSIASTLGGDEPFEFICECATPGCFERLSLTLKEYERVRSDGAHFLIAAGHEDIEVEQVIAVRDEFAVVEKDGIAGLVAHEEDPRA